MIITLCGGGSTFTPGIVKSIALRKDELDVDEIRLYDINEERQRKIGVLVDWIQEAYGKFDGIVMNPAAYTHTSVALLDALKAVSLPAAEVHLSNIYDREDFRHISYPGKACVKTVYGKGFAGYEEAICFLKNYIQERKETR